MQTQNQPQERCYVGVKETLLYGVANGGQCLGYGLMDLMFYLVTVFGVPYKAVFFMVTALGFWDAFNDPLMGSLVDRTRTRFGKMRPYLLFIPLPLGLLTILFLGGAQFLHGVQSDTVKIVYMWVVYFIWEFLYTIGDIPFWGLSAAISPSVRDRSRAITSARFISGVFGVFTGVLMPVMIDLSRAGKISWGLPGIYLFFAILAGTFGIWCFSLAGTQIRERVVQSTEGPKLLDCFRYMFRNKPLLLLIIQSILGTVEGVGDRFSRYFYVLSLGLNSLSLLAGIPGTVMGFFTYLLIPWFEKRWSSKQIIIRITLMKAAVATVIFLAGCRYYTRPAVIVPLLGLQGFFYSIVSSLRMVIPTKMIGDTVDYMEYKTGERGEGMAFSVLTFIGKLTGTLCTGLSTLIMPLIGLQNVKENLEMAVVDQAKYHTNFWLWGLMTMIPAVLNLISLIPLLFYDLEGEKLRTIHESVRERRSRLSREMTRQHTLTEEPAEGTASASAVSAASAQPESTASVQTAEAASKTAAAGLSRWKADNICPKCGKKLSIFYLKPVCPNCGCNIMYYDMENRLNADADLAEAEWARLNATLDRLIPKVIKKRMEKKKTDSAEEPESGGDAGSWE